MNQKYKYDETCTDLSDKKLQNVNEKNQGILKCFMKRSVAGVDGLTL